MLRFGHVSSHHCFNRTSNILLHSHVVSQRPLCLRSRVLAESNLIPNSYSLLHHHQIRNASNEKAKSKPKPRASAWMRQEAESEAKKEGADASQEAPKPKKGRIGNIFSKPMSFFKRRKAKTDDSKASQKKREAKPLRPGKTPLPAPEEGVMQHIPRDKAQILHILQNECELYPDEVFPLFPDHKVEDVLIGMLAFRFLFFFLFCLFAVLNFLPISLRKAVNKKK